MFCIEIVESNIRRSCPWHNTAAWIQLTGDKGLDDNEEEDGAQR